MKRTFSVGAIHYDDHTTGTLVVVKCGVPEDAPLDVASYHERNPRFP